MSNLFKFYFDFMSPLSRPFWILFEHTGVRCDKISVALRKGEHLTESFAVNVNRFKKVPAIIDGDFKLAESVAIYQYLGRKKIIPSRWYPADIKSLSRIDEFLEWQHTNLCSGAGLLFYKMWVAPMTTGEKSDPQDIKNQIGVLNKNLHDLENIWLKDHEFLAGNEISFADLMAASLLEQVIALNLYKIDKEKYTKVDNWMNNVRDFFGRHYDEAHKIVRGYGAKFPIVA